MPCFVVLDGHGGAACAEAASKELAANIAKALEQKLAATGVSGEEARAELAGAMVEGFALTEAQCEAAYAAGGDKSGACA
eukprot:1038902-Rhodomonas_salina.1